MPTTTKLTAEGGRSTHVRLDATSRAQLAYAKKFYLAAYGLDASEALIVRRALECLTAHLSELAPQFPEDAAEFGPIAYERPQIAFLGHTRSRPPWKGEGCPDIQTPSGALRTWRDLINAHTVPALDRLDGVWGLHITTTDGDNHE